MNFWKFSLVLILSAFLFVSCNGTDSSILNLKDLVAEVDEVSDDCTKEDLTKNSEEYETVVKEFEKYELTDEQLQEVGELQGQFIAKMGKASMNVVGESFENLSKQLESGMKGFMKELEKDE